MVRVEFRRNMGVISWDRFVQILLDLMRNKVEIAENEVCGEVGLSGQFICVDPSNYVIIPIATKDSVFPYEIVIMKGD